MPDTTLEHPRTPAGQQAPRRWLGWSLAALVIASTAVVDPWGLAPFGPARWTAVTVATLAAAAALAGRRVAVRRAPTLAWLFLLGWMLLATVRAVDPLHAWVGTPDRRLGWLAWALFALAFLCGQALTADGEARLVVRAAALGAGVLGLYSVAEVAGVLPWAREFAAARLGGPYGQPAYLGAAAALLVPAAAGLAADAGEPPGWRRVAALASALGAFALLASQTRAAWVGVAVAVALLLPRLARGARRRPVAAGVVLAALVTLALATPAGGRALSIVQPGAGAAGRVDEWRVAATALAERPVLGAGPEGYRVVFTSAVDAGYARTHGREVLPDRAHNGALDAGVSGGLPALAAYLALVALVLAGAWPSRRAASPWLAGTGAGVIAYAVQQQFLFPLSEIDPVFWVLAGLVVGRSATLSRRSVRVPAAAAALWLLAAGALVAGALEVAADRDLRRATVADGPFDHAVAVALADRATSLRPDSTRAWFVAARIAARGDAITDVDAALDRAEAGLARSPVDPALRAEHAALLLQRAQRSGLPGDVARATGALQDLVADDPHHPGHRLRLAAALALAGDEDAASGQRRAAEDLAP